MYDALTADGPAMPKDEGIGESMADELVLYTNPMSRGRIARWMLEEVGQPYRTEVLDYASTMKAPAYLAINPMGKVPAMRHGDAVVTENGRDLRLSRRRVSAGQAGAAAGRSAARALLSLAVLRRRPGRSRREQQGAGLCGAAGTRADDRLRQLRAGHEHARSGGVATATISPATNSPPPTSMSARRSASA